MCQCGDSRVGGQLTFEVLYADVYTGGESLYLSLDEIEHRLALGQIGLDAQIKCPPLTGDETKPIWMIERFADCANTPEARMMAHMRGAPVPVFSMLLLLSILCGGLLQQRGWFNPQDMAIGWSSISIHNNWWAPWGYWLVHLDWMHWVGNGVLAYFCAQRVERIVGGRSLMLYVSCIVLGSSMAVWMWESNIVIGASILVFGLWAMQVVLGFRLAHSLPPRMQSNYGWGNFLVFVPTLLLNTLSADVSHVAHWVAMAIGAVLAVRCWPTTSRVRSEPTWGVWIWIVGVHGVVLLCSGLLSNAEIEYDGTVYSDAGFVLPVSERFYAKTWCEGPVYSTQGLMFYTSGEWITDSTESLSALVTTGLHDCLVDQVTCFDEHQHDIILAEELEVASGVQWHEVRCEGDASFLEYVAQRGELLLRVGCKYEGTSAKEECSNWLRNIQLKQSRMEIEAFQRWKSDDQRGSFALEYAEELIRYGRITEADALLKEVESRFDEYRWRGSEARLNLHRSYPKDWPGEKRWVTDIANSLPVDEFPILRRVLLLSKERKWCDISESAWARWREMMPTGLDEVGALVDQCNGD